MIEVFKTNVTDINQAQQILNKIHSAFPSYKANFDLQDCDHILRIKSDFGPIEWDIIVNLVLSFGSKAEILTEENLINELTN